MCLRTRATPLTGARLERGEEFTEVGVITFAVDGNQYIAKIIGGYELRKSMDVRPASVPRPALPSKLRGLGRRSQQALQVTA